MITKTKCNSRALFKASPIKPIYFIGFKFEATKLDISLPFSNAPSFFRLIYWHKLANNIIKFNTNGNIYEDRYECCGIFRDDMGQYDMCICLPFYTLYYLIC